MMQKFLLLFLLSTAALYSFGQSNQQIFNSGGSTKNNNLIDWTIGDAMIGTTTTSSNIVTTGFLQPDLLISSIEDITFLDNQELIFFPNPVTSIVNIQHKTRPSSNYFIEIYGSNGIKLGETKQGNSINVENLLPGLYILIVTENIATSTFKFIKH